MKKFIFGLVAIALFAGTVPVMAVDVPPGLIKFYLKNKTTGQCKNINVYYHNNDHIEKNIFNTKLICNVNATWYYDCTFDSNKLQLVPYC